MTKSRWNSLLSNPCAWIAFIILCLVVVYEIIPNSYGECIRTSDTPVRETLFQLILCAILTLIILRYSHAKQYFIVFCFAMFLVEHIIQQVRCYGQNKQQHIITGAIEILVSLFMLCALENKAFIDYIAIIVLSINGLLHFAADGSNARLTKWFGKKKVAIEHFT